jgi:carbonic anhydrase
MLAAPVSIVIATRAPDSADASAPGEWGYADSSNGPLRWGDILDADGKASYPACGCAACQQSPIDLVRTAARGNVRVGSLADRLVAPDKPVTLAVSQKHGTPNYVATDRTNGAAVVAPDGARYDFDSLHFHTPAENTVDGVANAMEMHMVHVSPAGDVAVLGVLFRHADADSRRSRRKADGRRCG